MSPSKRSRLRACRWFGLLVAACAFVLAASPAARASGTDPLLTLTQAQAFSTSGGTVAVDVRGVLPVEDYVQVDFPAGLLVAQGSAWTRYEFGGDCFSGTDPSVADGVTASEMLSLLGAGGASASPARVARTEAGRIQVVLPPELSTGSLSLLVYAVLDGDAYLSNVLTVAAP